MNKLAAYRIENAPATLREITLERMRKAIIGGVFSPAERLVERTLCGELGVSRSVIREVIRHLEAEGLVTSLPNRGPIVASLSWDDARQIYDIRAALESAAVFDCAARADDTAKKHLGLLLDDLDKSASEQIPTAVIDATTAFYSFIFESAGHNVAWEIVTRLNSRISRLRAMTLSSTNRMVNGPALIREIYTAIERNDPEEAATACKQHVASAARIAEQLLTGEKM